MISKYNNFILEKIKNDITLLFEGFIYGSDRFKNRLKIMSSEPDKVGEIANNLFNLLNDMQIDDSNISQNYFDLVDDEGKVSFIQNNKIIPNWKENNIDPYSLSGRNEIKIGRIVKYLSNITNLKLSDYEVEQFVNSFKSLKEEEGKHFRLVDGEDIAKYYDEDNYANQYGTLGESCMSDVPSKYFKIYCKNPKKVKLLIYVDQNDKIYGRALVWKLKNYPKKGSKYFMDRVYTSKDSDVIRFKNFARENDWMYKKNMGYSLEDNVKFIFNNSTIYGEINLKLNGDCKKYPFLDTLCFLNKDKDVLSNLSDKNNYWLQDTEGDCDICNTCSGSIFIKSNVSNNIYYCDCSVGHKELKKYNIETKLNKKI